LKAVKYLYTIVYAVKYLQLVDDDLHRTENLRLSSHRHVSLVVKQYGVEQRWNKVVQHLQQRHRARCEWAPIKWQLSDYKCIGVIWNILQQNKLLQTLPPITKCGICIN